MSRNRGINEESKIRALKKRIKFLERENSRLRKQIGRSDKVAVDQDEEIEIPVEKQVTAEPTYNFLCNDSKCKGTDYEKLELTIRGTETLFLLCKKCGKSHKFKK